MLDVKRLRLLREFAIRGTIGEVADVLSYSPSAVSQQLSLLERETGVKLLRRVGRGLVLTPAAERLVADTEELLNVLERAEASLIDTGDEISGTVRVAAFQSAMISLIPSALRVLSNEHPHLRVEVVQQEPETALHETWARGFDLVIAEQYPGHAAPHHTGLGRDTLGVDKISLALPRGEAFDSITGIVDAHALPWVMEPRGAASRHWAEQACRQAGFEPDIRFETADIQAHVRLVESGNAVAIMNGLSVHGREDRLRVVSLPDKPHRTIFTSSREASVRHPAIEAVGDALRLVSKDLPI